jgi:hypothetical protein
MRASDMQGLGRLQEALREEDAPEACGRVGRAAPTAPPLASALARTCHVNRVLSQQRHASPPKERISRRHCLSSILSL